MATGSSQYKSVNKNRQRLAGNTPAKQRRILLVGRKDTGEYVPKALSAGEGYAPKGSKIKVSKYSDEVPF